ncbi:MAG: hypothetical protein ABGW78_01185, partial [Pirellulales bacterium]
MRRCDIDGFVGLGVLVMASVSGDSSHPLAVGSWAIDADSASKSDRYVASRLATAGADYKGVAITIFILSVLLFTLGWLVFGVFAEHWLVSGGLPRWARWIWFATTFVVATIAVVRWIVPLIRYRVNLVYAARVIEQEYPDLHNDLVNAVLIKNNEQGSSQRMVRSLKRRAAKQLSSVPSGDVVMDRQVVLRLVYAIAAFIMVIVLYEVFAPKSLLTSSARLFAPWTSISAPSRVQIEPLRLSWRALGNNGIQEDSNRSDHGIQIHSSHASIVRGRQLLVQTKIEGLRSGEMPILSVRPLKNDGSIDRSTKSWKTKMNREGLSDSDDQYLTILPDSDRGVDRSVQIELSAGDARLDPIKLTVVDEPSLLVKELQYDFPAYTQLQDEVVLWQGDIRAIEGTSVTVVASGNRAIKEAWIDFGCDGRRDKKMLVSPADPTQASVSFRLHPDLSSEYGFLFQPHLHEKETASGLLQDELQYRIEVVPDISPEISIEEPEEAVLRVPPDAPVEVLFRAVDPDFGLTKVGMEVRIKDVGRIQEIDLLTKPQRDLYRGGSLLIPRQLGAGPGQVLEYRGVAVDNRPERPNETRTNWQSLIVDNSAPARQPSSQDTKDDTREDENKSEKTSGSESLPEDGMKDSQRNEKSGDDSMQDSVDQQSENGSPESKQPREGAGETGQPEGVKDRGMNTQPDEGNAQEGVGSQAGDTSDPTEPGNDQRSPEGEQSTPGDTQQERSLGSENQSQRRQPEGQQNQQSQEDVASDGTNDGEAVERILEHRRQHLEQEKGEQGQGEQGQGEQGQGEQGQGEQGQGEQGQGEQGQG